MSDITVENIRDWQDHDVVDTGGDKIGSLESVYFDTATDAPTFAAVQIGIPGRRRLVFAPLIGAVVAPKYIKLQADKKTIKNAPSIETDGELTTEIEAAVFEHYGLPYSLGAEGERRLGRR
ncbi:PRC-barrel domain-containing protein [Amnibacterium flavum]|uniref:Photosystem reaction center subunit H n=1 Tax=Amnibacterium flavum TaxID=2173173 RepID=A0A2V1HXX0_9MICO|nr:PRC-barrel domain-containing protein [Amnibacterium flavum]PVZ95557.1 photosystem reaction center subunit H [Amnibacterium flavum]